MNSLLKGIYWYLFTFASICVSSFYAGKYTKDFRLTVYTGTVSILSFSVAEIFFPLRTTRWEMLITPFVLASLWGMFSWGLKEDYAKLWEKKFDRRYLKSLVLLTFALCFVGGVAWIVITNFSLIVYYLDSHPWIPTVIIGLLTFIGGVLFGKKKKRES